MFLCVLALETSQWLKHVFFVKYTLSMVHTHVDGGATAGYCFNYIHACLSHEVCKHYGLQEILLRTHNWLAWYPSLFPPFQCCTRKEGIGMAQGYNWLLYKQALAWSVVHGCPRQALALPVVHSHGYSCLPSLAQLYRHNSL